MTVPARLLIIGVLVIFASAGIWSCGNDSTSNPPALTVEQFINSIGTFSSPAAEFDIATGSSDTTLTDAGGVEVCSVEEFEMGRNPEEIVAFSPNDVALWPGCIVQGEFVGYSREHICRVKAPATPDSVPIGYTGKKFLGRFGAPPHHLESLRMRFDQQIRQLSAGISLCM